MDPLTVMLIAAGVQTAVGVGGALLSGRGEKRAARRYGATAQNLEAQLTGATLQRLRGQLDPATRAMLQRADEATRARTEAAINEFTRTATRRGLRGSGLLERAAMLTREQTGREGAAARADIETRTYATAQERALGLAEHFRGQEARQTALGLARQQMWLSLASQGMQMGGYMASQKWGGDMGSQGRAPSYAATRSVTEDWEASNEAARRGIAAAEGPYVPPPGPVEGYWPPATAWGEAYPSYPSPLERGYRGGKYYR